MSGSAQARTVLLASPRSFCAGVERAIAVVENLLDQRGGPIYVRKQIVHNVHVVADLQARGAVFVDELAPFRKGRRPDPTRSSTRLRKETGPIRPTDVDDPERRGSVGQTPFRQLNQPYGRLLSSERAASSALTVADACPPRIRSIAERSSVIAPAGIPSQ